MMNDDTIKRTDAINALFQMDSTKIDKAHAIGEIRSIPSTYIPQDPHAVTYINALKNRIKELEADRPQGEWILLDDKHHIEKIYLCSNCENFEAWGESEKYNYCPNCGARMKGAENE